MLNPNPPAEDVKLKSLATSNLWRQCVKCNHMIELAEGCYHMTCRYYSSSFQIDIISCSRQIPIFLSKEILVEVDSIVVVYASHVKDFFFKFVEENKS